MPISIPTSVAGVSVPGAVNGPLNLLYGNKYNKYTYSYPRDLASNPSRNHVIVFTVLEPAPDSQQGVTETAVRDLKNSDKGSIVDNTKTVVKQILVSDIKRKLGDTIALYIPDTVNVTYSAAYEDVSLTESLGKAYFLAQAGVSMFDNYADTKEMSSQLASKVGNDPFVRTMIAGAIGAKLGAKNLPELAAKGLGVAMNPQLQVLFKSIGFRTFQFDFILTPYSKEEAKQIEQIIKAFKYAAAPKIKPNSFLDQGMFMDVPYPFDIKFLYKGKENQHVHKIGQSVLENVSVDYAPNGWATFNDGTPMQTKLTLQFKETVIIDKTRISEGY